MDEGIGIGLVVGAVTGTSIYVYQSDSFSKAQKAFLLICIVFPPLQWVSTLVLLGINNYRKNSVRDKSTDFLSEREEVSDIDDKIFTLDKLRDSQILTAEEYDDKVSGLKIKKNEAELKLSDDYKNLKKLFDSEILSQEEFDSKVEVLKEKVGKYKVKSEPEPEFKVVSKLVDELYLIVDSDLNYGFADIELNKVIDTVYGYADVFSEGLALVKLNGRFGYINAKNEVVVSIIYEDAQSFKNGKAEVKLRGEKFLIDRRGDKLNDVISLDSPLEKEEDDENSFLAAKLLLGGVVFFFPKIVYVIFDKNDLYITTYSENFEIAYIIISIASVFLIKKKMKFLLFVLIALGAVFCFLVNQRY